MMNASCPICDEPGYTVLYKQLPQCPEADLVQCNACRHVYTLLTKEVASGDLYNDEVYKVVENRDSIFDKIITREYNGVLKAMDRLVKQKSSLLDFGAGKGKFGMLAKNDGWEVKCVETSPERAAYAREVYGLEVNTSFYAGGNLFNTYFGALTLFHVLEHLPHPKSLLEELTKDNLDKNALLVLEVPNLGSWQSGLARNRWIHLDVPRHINHFTPVRLEQFCAAIGWTPVKKSYYSFHLGVLGMVDSLLKRTGYRKNIIYELKNKKSKMLLVKIALVLPLAILLERLAAAAGKGGVIRFYLRRASN